MPRHKCVLLVDDDALDNMIHREVLRRVDFAERVDIATTGRRALEYLARTDPDEEGYFPPAVIFLDLDMPAMDGFEFLDALAAVDPRVHERTSVYVLSGSDDPRDRDRARAYERVRAFLVKPLSRDQLESL